MTTSDFEIIPLSNEEERHPKALTSDYDNRLIQLIQSFKKRLEQVKDNYEEIENVASPIVKEKRFFGTLETTNIDQTIENLLDIIKILADKTLSAFRLNQENLNDILKLMKMQSVIEKDLYDQMEKSDCSKETIACLLKEFCERYNLDSKEIGDLFEQSFNRTWTLRNRINNLRYEIFQKIEEAKTESAKSYDGKFKQYESEKDELKGQIAKLIEYNEESAKSYDGKFKLYESEKDELREQISTLFQHFHIQFKQCDELRGQIAKLIEYNEESARSYDEKFKLYESEKDELRGQISTLHKLLTSSFIVTLIVLVAAIISILI